MMSSVNTTFVAIWFLTYMVPALAAFVVIQTFAHKGIAKKHSLIAIHVALLISVLGSQYAINYFNLSFPWEIDTISIFALVLGFLFSFLLLKSAGLLYATSAFLQEMTMLSTAFLLLAAFPVHIVILLIIPLFVAGHFVSFKHWFSKTLLLSIWGVVSILIFATTQNLYLVAALHAIVGSIFSSKPELLLGKSHRDLKRGWLG